MIKEKTIETKIRNLISNLRSELFSKQGEAQMSHKSKKATGTLQSHTISKINQVPPLPEHPVYENESLHEKMKKSLQEKFIFLCSELVFLPPPNQPKSVIKKPRAADRKAACLYCLLAFKYHCMFLRNLIFQLIIMAN